MSYARHMKPRPEVLSEDGIEGIVDLRNLEDRRHRKLESRPGAFLGLTYPTADIKRVVQRMNDRFSQKSDTPALFLFEGLKGSGKSHLLVLIYHLLKHPAEGAKWLSQHDLSLNVPPDAAVVAHKYTDRPLLRLWDFIFTEAGIPIRGRFEVYPDDQQVLDAVGSRHLCVILDELEQGILMISDEALRRQNVAFLQMLSELGNRSPQVSVFGSIYDAGQEPGATLIRVPNVRVQFARASLQDRAKVVLHRLFEDFLAFEPSSVSGTVDSILNAWRRFIPSLDAEGLRRMALETYPFHPELLALVLERIPQRGGFQNIRGSLGFLANLVRLTHQTEDIIAAGHAVLNDRETATRLQDLDPTGDLINCAKANAEELAQYPLSAKIAATTMLYTLTGSGRSRGASRDEIAHHAMLPGDDINDFEQTLMAFRKYASHFHAAEGRFFFDVEENADAKVEFRSLTIDPGGANAKALLREIWTADVFRETENVAVFSDAEDTKAALENMRKNRLRIVLAPRQLAPEDRHELYRGLSVRNQAILLEPRLRDFDLDGNADLLKWAQRCLAAKELRDQAERAGDAARRDEYDRIGRDDRKSVADAIRRAGLQYIRFEAFGAKPADDHVEPENPGNATDKEQVVDWIGKTLFPEMVFQEHLGKRLEQVKNRLVGDVDSEYRETLTFPVPMAVQSVTRAIRRLCEEGEIGIYHNKGNYSNRDPLLSEKELLEAKIGEPVGEAPPTTTVLVRDIAKPGAETPTQPEAPGGEAPEVREESERIGIPFKPSISALRQEVAARLHDVEGARIKSVQFRWFRQSAQEEELSDLPSSLRGSLSGPGTISFEATVVMRGDMDKAQVEQLCEQLPSFQSTQYAADLEIVRACTQE